MDWVVGMCMVGLGLFEKVPLNRDLNAVKEQLWGELQAEGGAGRGPEVGPRAGHSWLTH